ncbi:hypothetical protein ASG21_12715 [Chryseobacterium sp. Leaf394]|nr:hypothetical protein ASG21_12715 [Chryseobacterium sp. Leaf394]
MIDCRIDGRFVTVGTYTPNSWGEDFYYGYLHGKKTDRRLKITSLNLLFIDTADTVTLHEIQKGRDYFYTSKKLDEIIESNKRLKITVYLKDLVTGKNEVREFILKRHKNTYHNGTFPHT